MKLLVLDRDGVINQDSADYIKSAAEWQPLPGALEAIARANHAGWRVVIASNQSGLARGLFTRAALDAMHNKMQALLAERGGRIDGVFICPHGPDENCACRKPKPGLLQQIAAQYQTTLAHVPFIGDSARDIAAARAVGAQPILVRTGQGRATEQHLPAEHNIPVYDDLAAAVEALLATASPDGN